MSDPNLSDDESSSEQENVAETVEFGPDDWVEEFFANPELKENGWEDISKDGDLKKQTLSKAKNSQKTRDAVSDHGKSGPKPESGMKIKCSYTGYFTRTGEEIESSEDVFITLGEHGLPKGIVNGITTMNVGEKARIRVSPEFGYGKEGCPEKNIPADTPLDYEVEVIWVENLTRVWDGVLKRVLTEGDGTVNPAEFGILTFSYVARLDETDEKTVFDEGDRLEWNMEEDGDRFFDGLKIALSSQTPNETSLFKLSSSVTFGDEGCDTFESGVAVPPNTSVWYEVTLHGFENEKTEQDCTTQEELLELVESYRQKGNAFFKKGEPHYQSALNRYEKADGILSSRFRESEDDAVRDLKVKVWNNMGLIAMKWEEWEFVVKKSNDVLGVAPNDVKALTRMGMVHMLKLEFDEAKAKFKKALKQDPDNKYVRTQMQKCKASIKRYKQMQQQRFGGFLG